MVSVAVFFVLLKHNMMVLDWPTHFSIAWLIIKTIFTAIILSCYFCLAAVVVYCEHFPLLAILLWNTADWWSSIALTIPTAQMSSYIRELFCLTILRQNIHHWTFCLHCSNMRMSSPIELFVFFLFLWFCSSPSFTFI